MDSAIAKFELLWGKVAEVRNPSRCLGQDLPIPGEPKNTGTRVLENELNLKMSVVHFTPCEPYFRCHPRIALRPPPDYGPEHKHADENNAKGSKASHNDFGQALRTIWSGTTERCKPESPCTKLLAAVCMRVSSKPL